ncbi:hypothetical protein AGMMS49531_01550 [Endomicrobiia bacterium]|nr:hypothetical protein AGMMS49531_01550 [Endomicrobiia bacterium]
MVVYCHLVTVASGVSSVWPTIKYIVKNPSQKIPLLKANSLTYLDTFLKEYFATYTGAIGVNLFFLLSGFLVPTMMERYNSSTFLINRFVRIFPLMWASIIISGLSAYFADGNTFSVKEYLLNMFLIKTTIGGDIRWVLPIEVTFYCIAAIIGKFNFKKALISVLSIFLLLACITTGDLHNLDRHPILYDVCYVLQFIPIIFIGTSIYLSKEYKTLIAKIACISFFIAIAFFSLNKTTHYYKLPAYGNWMTYLIVLGLWYAVYFIFEKGKLRLGSIIENMIQKISETGYPIYLLHVPIGFALIEMINNICTNSYIILAISLFCTLLFSEIVHIYIELPIISLGKRIIQIKNDKKDV